MTVELHLNTKALLRDVEAWLQENDVNEDFQIPASLIEKHIYYVEKLPKFEVKG